MICLNYSSGTGYCEYAGRSTDNKPTEGLETGSKFTEVDTGDEYLFNSVSGEWVKQPQSGGGGGGGNLQSKTATPTTSEQTITADDGYDGLSSVTVEAISPTKSAETYTPTTSDQTISAGSWLAGAQTIKGDANLVAGNIKKDVSIFSVVGTYEGGGNSPWHKLCDTQENAISTTSTSTTAAFTIELSADAFTSSKIIWVHIRDKAGKRSGYFFGSDAFFINVKAASGDTTNASSPALNILTYESGTYANNASGFGVFASSLSSDGMLTISQRYNQSISKTVDGTYVTNVYSLDLPDNLSLFDQ